MIDGTIPNIRKVVSLAYLEYLYFFKFLPRMTENNESAKLFVDLIMSKMKFNGEIGAPMFSPPTEVISSGTGNEIELSVIAKVLFEKIGLKGKLMLGTMDTGQRCVFVVFEGKSKFFYTAYKISDEKFVALEQIETKE